MLDRLATHATQIASWNAARLVSRTKRNTVLYGLAILFGLTAYGAAVAAGGLWLAERLDAIAALGILVLVSSALALAVWVITSVVSAYERRHEADIRRQSMNAVTAALAVGPVLGNSKPLLLALAGAGLAYFAMTADSGEEQDDVDTAG
tara:strand:+ start:30385 stop:30831 length:447 start_codon:yes stop_codon:yes gene_type:complete